MTCVDLAMIWISLLPNWTASDACAFDNQTKMILFKSIKISNRMQRRKIYLRFKCSQEVDYFLKDFIFNLRRYSEYIF